ncbi:MAG TPA: cytochrome c3 family protein [Alphaproteobacteria bacterium]|nr:cytochrome c3 family protein [Alphaproteobacteria bacterium]
MTRRWILAAISAALLGLGVLVFLHPDRMISPGALSQSHSELATDCFACHLPLHGASQDKCIACHALADIGLRTTKGLPLTSPKVAFHQQLASHDCMACHTGHQGVARILGKRRSFSHELLDPAVRGQCQECHAPPATAPHRGVTANCAQCHGLTGWKGASFDHGKFFQLEGPHEAPCATCHVGDDTSRYTCYECHAHQPDRIRAKHLREGIRDFENCARCHRNAHAEDDD